MIFEEEKVHFQKTLKLLGMSEASKYLKQSFSDGPV